ncbi:MAG: PqqD family protein [Anaeroplasma sp.]
MPISSNFMLKEVDKEYMIIPLSSDNVNMTKIYNLNEVGAFIYRCLEQNYDMNTLATKMSQEYNVSSEVAKNDIEEFIIKLKEKGIYYD